MKSTKIGFIGAGNMANSLIRGLLARDTDSKLIWASDIDERKLRQLADGCQINAVSSDEIARRVDVVVLAVKPQVMKSVCQNFTEALQQRTPMILSIAAGITLAHLQSWLGPNSAIVRCMPNTPALVGKGASGLFANLMATAQHKQLATEIMSSVGICVWLDKEADMDAVTALSGSGPAYYFLFMEAMQSAAKEMGLSEELARTLTYQTAAGAAELAQRSEEDTAELRRNVTSPGGTTEQAIKQFQKGDLVQLVSRALHAARQRSIELALEFGKE